MADQLSNPRVLISAQHIAARNRQLGNLLTVRFANQSPLVLPLLSGAFCFVADLVRHIKIPDLTLQFVSASSYTGTQSTGAVQLGALPDVTGRNVLLVDDILDTGRTLERTCAALTEAGAASITTCVLLDKPDRRVAAITADFIGFTIPDRFVIGYGLDYDDRYRHLPDVCTLDELD